MPLELSSAVISCGQFEGKCVLFSRALYFDALRESTSSTLNQKMEKPVAFLLSAYKLIVTISVSTGNVSNSSLIVHWHTNSKYKVNLNQIKIDFWDLKCQHTRGNLDFYLFLI